MSYVTRAFDYEILKDVKTMAGLGGALYYPELSISERMLLTIMNKRRPYMPKERNGEIFENFDNEEIEIFAKKIKRIDDAKA
jgi:menaquinone-dependent protoporphyrinogen IX oxidase